MSKEAFQQLKDSLLNLDPVVFCEKYLTLDGKPFRINKSGYKPFADIYRTIGIKSLEKNAKPIVLVKGRQTGGTVMASALCSYFMTSGLFGVGNRAPMRVIHCFPTLVHVFTYTKTKLNAMISGSVPVDPKVSGLKKTVSYIESKLDRSTTANESLQYKQFIGGNILRIESTGIDSSRLRGGTCDAIFYDECQMIPAAAISNANKMLTTAQYGKTGRGITVYFGTPLNKGSEFYKIWNKSSQQYFYLGCEDCGKHFPLYTPNSDSWETVWLYGFIVKCAHCGKEQNKKEAAERGKWVALGDPNADYIGFHINQLLLPFFSKEDIIAEKPENHPVNTERSYQNEVLGNFHSGDNSLITVDEIFNTCADPERKYRARILPSDNKKVYAGYDWGKKKDIEGSSEGQSYSCGVILSPDEQGRLLIEFATMLRKNDFEDKKAIVEEMFRKYSVNLAVGDVGYAGDLTEVLQRTYGDKFLASQTSAHVNGKVKYVTEYFPKVIVFEKDYYIAELIGLLKKGLIRFPYGDYERVSWLVQHVCSMETKITMSRLGEPVSHYVKGSQPNDGFAALLNAYLAYKFSITGGFKNQQINMLNPQQKREAPAILAHIPRLR
jgi:hypothetical protein